jgi:hypothetical protein
MSGVDPPGKPTRMRSGRFGQLLVFFKSFGSAAQVVHVHAAIKNVAISCKEDEDFMEVPDALKASLEQF